MATEIGILRAASIPEDVYLPIRDHAKACPVCRVPSGRFGWATDTRKCPHAMVLIEKAIQLFLSREAR